MTGTDGQLHSIEVEAESLFSAAHRGMREWWRFWWFSSDELIDVKAGQDNWRVRQERLQAWYGNGSKHLK
jgi:hypothetical protein